MKTAKSFPRQAIAKILCVLQFKYNWNIPRQVWFVLNNFMTH